MKSRVLVALVALLGTMVAPAGAGAQQADIAVGGNKEVVESTTGSYIVVMEADPLIVTEGRDNLNTRSARNRGQALARGHQKALDEAGVGSTIINDYVNALNGFSAVMSHDEAQKVAGTDGVAMVVPDEMRYIDTESSPTFLGLDGPAGAWSTGATGEGVVVGVIDSGIWPEHPSFADDGSYRAPTGVADDIACEFGNSDHHPADVAFECNNKLVGARQMLETYRALIGAKDFEFDSARDDNGHGTHTAATAAGNADVEATVLDIPRGTISGVAPRAKIIAYKGLGDLGGFGSDLAAAIDQAVADGVDVINYSVGGGASLTGPDDIAYLFAARAGVFVATSAGNAGPGPSTVGGPGSVPWITTVAASTQPRFFQGTVVLGDGTEFTGSSMTQSVGSTLLVDADFAGGDLCRPGTLDANAVAGKIVLCRRGAIARVAKSDAVHQAGGVGMIMYENSDDNSLFSDSHWVPSVQVDNTPGLAIKAYIAANPGTATAELVTEQIAQWEPAPNITYFSSRGPNPVAESIIKPDITAPGMQILSAGSPYPGPGSVPGELFMAISGTSMSSPHIAGVFALIKQEHPDWTPAMAKSAIMTTAYQDVRDNDRVSLAGPFEMGAGHVEPGSPVHKGSAFQPGLVYDAGFAEYLGFLCDAAPGSVAPSTCELLVNLGVPTVAEDLNLPSIGVAQLAGSHTVTRTVTSVASERGWRTFQASVDAPAGYTVTVSPSTLRLRSGQSATFEVTITNDGTGVVGEWSHGALTWTDDTGHYNVRSPISVRGAQIGIPLEISGSGTDGTASFDVNFGYDGPYTAAAHGLVPETKTIDNVVQDPDQTFDPNDGFSNRHDFTLSGAAHFRIAMPPEATPSVDTDLDIFVYDPNGDLVARSTSGGTDELINISLPADGTWSVYVHGWQTAPGTSADYVLSTWIVPPAGGGSLSLDSAPTTAIAGATGTVQVSWTGLAPDGAYLGAVSHSDADGVMSLTLVDVHS